MDLKQAYDSTMNEATFIALASCEGQQPNVRVVNFALDDKTPGLLYFASFAGSRKLKELENNPKVALTPLPVGEDDPASVRIFGTVAPARRNRDDISALLINKFPAFTELLKGDSGEAMAFMEVQFDAAEVFIGMEDEQILKL